MDHLLESKNSEGRDFLPFFVGRERPRLFQLTGSKANIMNEAGIATNTVVMHLSKRNRRNRLFRWEGRRDECRIGSCLFVTKHYVPLRQRRAVDSNSENSDVEDNVDPKALASMLKVNRQQMSVT